MKSSVQERTELINYYPLLLSKREARQFPDKPIGLATLPFGLGDQARRYIQYLIQ